MVIIFKMMCRWRDFDMILSFDFLCNRQLRSKTMSAVKTSMKYSIFTILQYAFVDINRKDIWKIMIRKKHAHVIHENPNVNFAE